MFIYCRNVPKVITLFAYCKQYVMTFFTRRREDTKGLERFKLNYSHAERRRNDGLLARPHPCLLPRGEGDMLPAL
jgi:hypothetical protein